MSAVAKLFKNGNSQAVRLPKEFRFENQEEVFIQSVQDGILIMPRKDKTIWDHMFENLDEFSEDFMTSREQIKQTREDLF